MSHDQWHAGWINKLTAGPNNFLIIGNRQNTACEIQNNATMCLAPSVVCGTSLGGFNDEVSGFLHLSLCRLIPLLYWGARFSSLQGGYNDGGEGRGGFLQLVARWLAAQTGLFLCCFWGGRGAFAMFALLLFCLICTTFSLSFFRVGQFLICHFNGLHACQTLSSVF